MRRDKEPGLVPGVLQGPRSLNRHCSFTVGPSYMHSLELVLWVSKSLCKVPHLIDVGFLSRAKLPIHVPFEDPFEALTVLLGH